MPKHFQILLETVPNLSLACVDRYERTHMKQNQSADLDAGFELKQFALTRESLEANSLVQGDQRPSQEKVLLLKKHVVDAYASIEKAFELTDDMNLRRDLLQGIGIAESALFNLVVLSNRSLVVACSLELARLNANQKDQSDLEKQVASLSVAAYEGESK